MVLLGFNAVRNAIVSVSVINALPKTLLFQDFEMIEFWKHSLAVAVTSKNIAQKAGTESPDNCFVGGLLHDVGKVIMAQLEDSADWYASLAGEIEAAHAFFLEEEF